MGFGRAKRAKKALSFYRMSFGLDPPYRVLCDTSFIAQAAAKNIDIRHYLNKLLQERNWPVVTECVLAEIARAGPTLLAASLAAAKFSVIPCPDHAELARQRAAELQAQAHVHDDDDASTHEEQDDDDDDDDNDDETSAAVADDDEDDDDDDDDDEDTDQHESTHDHEHDDSATLEPLGTEPENAGENLRVSSLRCIWDLLDKGEMVCVASMSKRLQQLVRERARFPLLFISHGTLILDKPNPNAVAIAREREARKLEHGIMRPSEYEPLTGKKRKRNPNPLSRLRKKPKPAPEKPHKKTRRGKRRRIGAAPNEASASTNT